MGSLFGVGVGGTGGTYLMPTLFNQAVINAPPSPWTSGTMATALRRIIG